MKGGTTVLRECQSRRASAHVVIVDETRPIEAYSRRDPLRTDGISKRMTRTHRASSRTRYDLRAHELRMVVFQMSNFGDNELNDRSLRSQTSQSSLNSAATASDFMKPSMESLLSLDLPTIDWMCVGKLSVQYN